jgi:RimJ/RimL family protein N-acetyltransferase
VAGPVPVRLRIASREDLAYLSRLAQDPLVEPFLAPGAGAVERLEAVLAETSADGDPGGLFVIVTASGEPAGGLALQVIGRHSRICEITRLMVDPRVRRSGIGAEAVTLACRHALVEHGFHRVQVETYGDNLAAQRLFERVGFVREGARRRAYWRRDQWLDGVLYGILAEELE